MPIPIPVELGQPQAEGGLLTAALPLPSGWQRGIAYLDLSCLSPVVMGECPTGENLKPGQRPESATFRPVSVIQAIECSASNQLDLSTLAGSELDRVRSFALAREMLTGAASARDASDPDHANPSLVGTATDLGADFTSVASALGCLEAELAEANSGRGGVILASIGFATAALAERVIWRDGARWRTVTGSTVIVSGGFDGRGPGAVAPPAADAPLYAYGTTAVWAGVGERATYQALDRAVNTDTARAEDIALVAFSICAVFAAASTTAVAC